MPPSKTGSGESVIATERSAVMGTTIVLTEALLLKGLPSGLSELAVAVDKRLVSVVGFTMTVIVTLKPEGMSPRLHVKVPPACEQVPCDDVAETKLTL